VLRFDCFQEDPHYHYVSWSARSNEMLHMDPVADGDPLAWALERLRTRLPQMLERAGAAEAAARVDLRRVDALPPRVAVAPCGAPPPPADAGSRRAGAPAGGGWAPPSAGRARAGPGAPASTTPWSTPTGTSSRPRR